LTVKIDITKCVACGLCVEICPLQAIKVVKNKSHITEKCDSCGYCLDLCIVDAISGENGMQPETIQRRKAVS
jgi:electron transfer flavoprotein alpha subunit